jgi:2-oxo-4-hydroxy-4-carboxy--5-ureidoimidazoline (OHCU) decarboxylase
MTDGGAACAEVPSVLDKRDHHDTAVAARSRAIPGNPGGRDFPHACHQVERIALHRISDLLPA